MNGMFTKTKTTRNTNININNSLEVLCKLIENPHVSLRDVSSKPKKKFFLMSILLFFTNTF